MLNLGSVYVGTTDPVSIGPFTTPGSLVLINNTTGDVYIGGKSVTAVDPESGNPQANAKIPAGVVSVVVGNTGTLYLIASTAGPVSWMYSTEIT